MSDGCDTGQDYDPSEEGYAELMMTPKNAFENCVLMPLMFLVGAVAMVVSGVYRLVVRKK